VPRKVDEPVRLTRIYTRGGDKGETSLGDGSRTSKLDCRIGAFGTVDELNAQIGLALVADLDPEARRVLDRVQNELFDVGADLSVPYGVGDGRLRVTQDQVDALEEQMLAGLTKAQISSLRRNLHACHANLAGQGRG